MFDDFDLFETCEEYYDDYENTSLEEWEERENFYATLSEEERMQFFDYFLHE